MSQEAASAQDQQLLAALSPPHFDCLPETALLGVDLALGGDLTLGEDLALGDGVVLGLGFAVLVLVSGGAWVTSNCTSLGVDPSAAAYTW